MSVCVLSLIIHSVSAEEKQAKAPHSALLRARMAAGFTDCRTLQPAHLSVSLNAFHVSKFPPPHFQGKSAALSSSSLCLLSISVHLLPLPQTNTFILAELINSPATQITTEKTKKPHKAACCESRLDENQKSCSLFLPPQNKESDKKQSLTFVSIQTVSADSQTDTLNKLF